MGFLGFYRLDEDTPDTEHVTKRKVSMRSIQRSRQSVNVSSLPSRKKGNVSISCPRCQSDRTHRSRTRGIVESLLVFLRIRPYRYAECDYRFFRWGVQHRSKTTRSPRTMNA